MAKKDKTALKRILGCFDKDFQEVHGRRPAKTDKVQLRPLYHRYNELRRHVALLESEPEQARALAHGQRRFSSDLATVAETSSVASVATSSWLAPGLESKAATDRRPAEETVTFDGNITAPLVAERATLPAKRRSASEAAPTSSEALKKEKLRLQKVLYKYQTQFQEEHGRAPRSNEDRSPYAAEYRRYKELKRLLAGQ